MADQIELNRESGQLLAPTARGLTAIFLFALLLRCLLTLACGWRTHNYLAFEIRSDGEAYTAMAQAFNGDMSNFTAYRGHNRAFPGLPALIALVSRTGMPLVQSGIAISWVSSALAAVLTAILFRDRRIGWAMTCLPPSWLLYTLMIMTEGSLVLLSVTGVLLFLRKRPILAGLCLGIAGTIRPTACFAVLACGVHGVLNRRTKAALIMGAVSGAVVALASILLMLYFGQIHSLHAYGKEYQGEIVTWPFKSLIMTPFLRPTSLLKIAYVWCYVAMDFAACGILCVRWWKGRAHPQALGLTPLGAVWVVSNTLFSISVGSFWGFHLFHRFILPALPAILLAFQPWLPRRVYWYLLAAAPSVVIVMVSIVKELS